MTVAPAYPLVHAYEGENPNEIIDSKWGRMERWRASALSTGEVGALTSLSEQVRNDAATIAARQDARERELNARADAINARELQHAVNVTQFVDFVGKASVLFDRLHKLRADQAEEPLSLPPGLKSEEPGPALADGTPPGDPSETADQTEFPEEGELPTPPAIQQPTSVGLDEHEQEANRGD